MKQLLFFVISCCIISNQYAQNRPKALILTGNGNVPVLKGIYPPWVHEFHNEAVASILHGIVDVDTTADLRQLNAQYLKQYDLLISNSLFLDPTEEGLKAIYNFVAGGKSYMTLHCGILSLLNWDRYEEFMGGIFIGGPSTDPSTYRVYTSNEELWGYKYRFRDSSQHPVSRAVNDFDIEDEMYYFQPSTARMEVIARAENHPVMWWHPVGKGKVMSLTLGHDLRAKGNPGYQELLKNGVRWLTGYPLIYPDRIPVVSNRELFYNNFIQSAVVTEKGTSIHSIINPDSLYKIVSGTDLSLDGSAGSAAFMVSVKNDKGRITNREITLSVVKDGTGNIAAYYGNTISGTASENTNIMFDVRNIIDSDVGSRWSSRNCEQAEVTLDLKKEYPLSRILIHWEASYAKRYNIWGSGDGRKWTIIQSVSDGDGGDEELTFSPTTVRFIRLDLQEKAAGKRGYSIYEMEVFVK
ncbi:ThuA domain-containing protein [Chitinophaga rhizophila]|uniref:ThuA domain-containing protein n=1 Tax=Chitinophaga rhizophila TaxID=2866212 RepID=A0ABS7G5A7_9BACT|nr:ThuA domain-containing protein [Chitinophaga rhizophila]MBW8682838.1 ThuA domain-containing protein [Chitinophaga rhizophila]